MIFKLIFNSYYTNPSQPLALLFIIFILSLVTPRCFLHCSMFTRPHKVTRLIFLFYLHNLLNKITHIFCTLTSQVVLSSYQALLLCFYSSSKILLHTFSTSRFAMERLCFTILLAIYISITGFHRLTKRHALRTKKKRPSVLLFTSFCLF